MRNVGAFFLWLALGGALTALIVRLRRWRKKRKSKRFSGF